MKKLIIKAHPSPQGLTHRLVDEFVLEAEKSFHQVKILDLYAEDMDFLKFENESELPRKPEMKKYRELLAWADEFVFFFPVWWYDSPSIVKNFYDSAFVSHLAFVYESSLPTPLFKDKQSQFICTSGGPGFLYDFRLLPLKRVWHHRMAFCGAKIRNFLVLGPKSRRAEERIEKFICKIKKIAQK
ncbi:MAG: NAD(P)H-dependent oxidoreductase [Candidatus Gracilibacteria bacterium]|jgi:NAD(P)H dehydrogenase (quinone)|nr:NAD(P)H-dependent oxidoreductase [Candidatus Gracilibacteria bacterium]